ncbi:MAG: gluconeogenesis factor YvcK family protein [bacterium]
MLRLDKWLYPGIKIKRWVFLLLLSAIVLGVGISGILGGVFKNIRIEAFNIDHWFRKLQRLKFIDYFLLLIGILGVSLAVRRAYFSILTMLMPNHEKDYINLIYRKAKMKRGPKVVAIGGGTGMPNVLRGMKKYTYNITAVVTVADDGGSSGRLRKTHNVLPPGDIRNCLVALSDEEALLGKLFKYRFDKDASAELAGHNFGNIFITALADVTGDFASAVKESSKVLAINGEVFPVSLDNLVLKAKLKDGREISGQSLISQGAGVVEELVLMPENITAYGPALAAIKKADAIIYGPGSLYTSVIINLLVPGIKEAIKASKAYKVYVCNIMTQPGETTAYTVSDHVRALIKHAGPGIVDAVIANNQLPKKAVLSQYEKKNSYPVQVDREEVLKLGVKLIEAKTFTEDDFIRHDPQIISKLIMKQMII